MNLHPLRMAYIQVIRDRYGASTWGDKSPERTELAANKVASLGLSYDSYVDLAVRMLEPTAKHFGWKYPYWNTIISDKTIAKVQHLANVTPVGLINDNPSEDDMFELELTYAVDYVEWWMGRGDKPHKCAEDVPPAVKTRVAEYLCRLWGIPYTSSNYNVICETLEKNGH